MTLTAGAFLPIEILNGIDAARERIFEPVLEGLEKNGALGQECLCFPVNGDWKDALARAVAWPGRHLGVFALLCPEKIILPDGSEHDPENPPDIHVCGQMRLDDLRTAFAFAHSSQKSGSWSDPDIQRMVVTRRDGRWVYGGFKAPDALMRAMKYMQSRILDESKDTQEFRDMRFLFLTLPVFLCTMLGAEDNSQKVSADYYPLLFCGRFLVQCRRRFLRCLEGEDGEEELGRALNDIALIRSLPDEPKSSPLGRNDPCFCGSGKKYKKCHMKIFD